MDFIATMVVRSIILETELDKEGAAFDLRYIERKKDPSGYCAGIVWFLLQGALALLISRAGFNLKTSFDCYFAR